MENIIDIAKQDLDVYGLELASVLHLDKVTHADLIKARNNMERLIEDIDKII